MTEEPDALEVVVGCGPPPQAMADVLRADVLTAALEQAISAADSARALRALAGRVLFVPYPGPAPDPAAVSVVELALDKIPLPLVRGGSGGRFLPAFSSSRRLVECAGRDDAAWILLPAAWLAARCSPDAGLLIDSGSSFGLLLRGEMLSELVLQSVGASTRWSITDGSGHLRAGLPTGNHAEETAAVQRVASRHPEVAAVHVAAFALDEADGRVWLAFGFQPDAGAHLDAALGEAATELASVTGDHVTLAVIGSDAPAGSAERFLLDEAPTVYTSATRALS